MKQDIEKLLHWAYRDELPKQNSHSAWDTIATYGQRGGQRIDDQLGPVMRLPDIFGEPHPDALAIGRAVRQLEDTFLEWSESGKALMGDAAGLLDANFSIAALRTQALITMHAKMGTRPDWEPGPIKICAINPRTDEPMPVERLTKSTRVKVIGECYGKERYSPDSYCPLLMEPPARQVAVARAEYAAWHAGLVKLVSLLTGQLSNHEATLPACSPNPWQTGDIKSRILQCIKDSGISTCLTPKTFFSSPVHNGAIDLLMT